MMRARGILGQESWVMASADVRLAVEALGWTVLGVAPSPIAGGAGAQEFLLAARHG